MGKVTDVEDSIVMKQAYTSEASLRTGGICRSGKWAVPALKRNGRDGSCRLIEYKLLLVAEAH